MNQTANFTYAFPFSQYTEEIDQAIAKIDMQKLSHTEFRRVGTATEDVHYVRINEVTANLDDHMVARTGMGVQGVGTAIEIEKKFDFQKNLVALV